MIENVIFDLGGVLLRWNPDELLAPLYPDAATRERIKHATLLHADWQDYDRGKFSEEECIGRLARNTGRPHAEIAKLLQAVKEFLTPMNETIALLEELAGNGTKLFCLSNMAEATFLHVQPRNHFWKHFDGIVISAREGVIKPQREIYQRLIARYEIEPSRSVFVDDSAKNVEAARQVGLHAILFSNARDCRRQLLRMLWSVQSS